MLYSIQVGAVIFLAVTAFSLAILVCGARVSRKEGDDYSAVGILFKSVLATVAYLSISWMYFSYSGDKTTTFILMVMLLIFPAIWLIAEIKFKDRTDHQVRRVG